jgi:23S rRNA (cytosine1962-C5)-methyltransferase
LNRPGLNIRAFFPNSTNWDFCGEKIQQTVKEGKTPRILNLFAYTGEPHWHAAAAGAAEVVHVDASKGMIARANENVTASGLTDRLIRFIAEDCSDLSSAS